MDEFTELFASVSLGPSRGRATRASSLTEIPSQREAAPSGSLPTSDISLVSHAHGRQRREERGISRRDLQEAVKHGLKERANPGRNGERRWRYTYRSVVYVTDESSRHEVTSWRLDPENGAPSGSASLPGVVGAHIILVIDASGSMNRRDVSAAPDCPPSSRIEAVYQCLAKDLVDMLLAGSGRDVGKTVVSILEFSDSARVLVKRAAVNAALSVWLKSKASSARGSSHGNYLPALDKTLELIGEDSRSRSSFLVVFLSDGAPSDKYMHPDDRLEACCQRVKQMGQLLGQDRVIIGTVAFGPAGEDYGVLKSMAQALPRHSFQKLGLSINCLRTTLNSLSSDFSSMCTELAGRGPATLSPRIVAGGAAQRPQDDASIEISGQHWDVYSGDRFVSKEVYDMRAKGLRRVKLLPGGAAESDMYRRAGWRPGVAFGKSIFSHGAERFVHACTEVWVWDGGDASSKVVRSGSRLLAKEAKRVGDRVDDEFHPRFCRTAEEAEELAVLFNNRLKGGAPFQVHFLQCTIYKVQDGRYPGGLTMLVEEELEGAWTKWNNNAGACSSGPLLGIAEGFGEGDEEDEEAEEAAVHSDVPQCFSHFSYVASDGKKLVCDLQGVWNAIDGFKLTDPVIHHCQSWSKARRNGATDKGMEGIDLFFQTHVCNRLCVQLGLDK